MIPSFLGPAPFISLIARAISIAAVISIAINVVQVTITAIAASDRTKKYEEAKRKYKM